MKAWSDIFSEDVEEPIGEGRRFEKLDLNASDSQIKPILGDSYVFDCYFHLVSSPSQGGVIYFSLSGSSILLESCFVYNCSTRESAGCCCIKSGNTAIYKVCSQHCTAKTNDGFSYSLTDSRRNFNIIRDSSIAHNTALQQRIMAHGDGFVEFVSLNLSFNSAKENSALMSQPGRGNKGIGAKLLYCSFSNYTAEVQYCMYMSSVNGASTYLMKYSNILCNEGNNVIYITGIMNISSSCILGNIAVNTFYIFSGSSCTLIGCSIDSSVKGGSGKVDDELVGKESFIIGLTFTETGLCLSTFDSYGNLTATLVPPDEPTRIITKQKSCQCTFNFNKCYWNMYLYIAHNIEFTLIACGLSPNV